MYLIMYTYIYFISLYICKYIYLYLLLSICMGQRVSVGYLNGLRMTQRLVALGTVDQGIYIWSLHLIWASQSTVAGL